MAKDSSFHEYVMTEVFNKIPNVNSRAMFGGYGIYKDGFFFALIADGRLYFKVDESNREDFESADSKAFTFESKKGKIEMLYFELPTEVLESPVELETWVEKSVAVARKSKKK